MRVDNDEPVGPRRGDRVGNHPRAEGLACCGPAILPGVAEVRHDRGHPRGTGPAAGVQQQQQFDKMVVDRRCCGLNDINIGTTDVFDHRAQLPVGVALEGAAIGLDAQMVGDRTGQAGIGTARDDAKNCGGHRAPP